MLRKSSKNYLSYHKITILIIGVVAIGIAGYLILHSKNQDKIVVPSTDPIKASQQEETQNSSANVNQSNSQSTSANNDTSSGPAPSVPTGNFVSNHHPGGDNPTSESSVCNTSAGATCYIQFTNGSIVKKLDEHTVAANGSAIWYWDVKSSGLSAGNWTVSAIATFNNQTRSADDAQKLVIL